MFYDVYKSLCEKVGKRPYTVAREIGLGTSNVAQWQKGSTPRPEVLQKLGDYFNVSQAELLGLDQKEKPATVIGDEQSETMRDIVSMLDGMSEEELALVAARLRKIIESRD